MKKHFNVIRLSLTLALVAAFSLTAFAGPKRQAAKTNTQQLTQLQSEIRRIVDSPSERYGSNLGGEAEIFFSLDANKRIQVKGVFATSDALGQYIEAKLDGATLRRNISTEELSANNFRMKLRMEDLR